MPLDAREVSLQAHIVHRPAVRRWLGEEILAEQSVHELSGSLLGGLARPLMPHTKRCREGTEQAFRRYPHERKESFERGHARESSHVGDGQRQRSNAPRLQKQEGELGGDLAAVA